MVMALCNPYRVDVYHRYLPLGGAPRLRRCVDPGLWCFDPVGVAEPVLGPYKGAELTCPAVGFRNAEYRMKDTE